MLRTVPLSVPLYITDADGWLTYYNAAAAALFGRHPEIGKDRWCGSWRIYQLDGTPLPHDQCGMAIALKQRRDVGVVEAVLERPDGSRVAIMAHPKPMRDLTGAIIGGSNFILNLGEVPSQEPNC